MPTSSRTVQLDRQAIDRMLAGRGGDVSKVMGGLAGVATRTVRDVASERITSRTGTYMRGIKATLVRPQTVRVEARAAHSLYLERGTRPHVIVPVRAMFLRFTVGTQVVFARRVNHPGTRAYNILRDGVRRSGTRLNQIARRG